MRNIRKTLRPPSRCYKWDHGRGLVIGSNIGPNMCVRIVYPVLRTVHGIFPTRYAKKYLSKTFPGPGEKGGARVRASGFAVREIIIGLEVWSVSGVLMRNGFRSPSVLFASRDLHQNSLRLDSSPNVANCLSGLSDPGLDTPEMWGRSSV